MPWSKHTTLPDRPSLRVSDNTARKMVEPRKRPALHVGLCAVLLGQNAAVRHRGRQEHSRELCDQHAIAGLPDAQRRVPPDDVASVGGESNVGANAAGVRLHVQPRSGGDVGHPDRPPAATPTMRLATPAVRMRRPAGAGGVGAEKAREHRQGRNRRTGREPRDHVRFCHAHSNE